MGSHHYVQYQKKTNDLILRKFREEQTDRQDHGQTGMTVISEDAVRLMLSVQQE